MKKTLLIISFLFFQNGFSQIDKSFDISEAVNYLNLFLSDVNPFGTTITNLTYNNYDKTLSYKLNHKSNNYKNKTLDISYTFSTNNVVSIKETILKYKDYNSLCYNFYLFDEIFKVTYSSEDGNIIPDYKNKKVNEVGFATEKKLTDQDVEKIKETIRNIFKNIPVKTEVIN